MQEIDKKTYEIAYMLRFEEDSGEIAKGLNEHEAKILKENAVTPLKFAYPIKKEKSGFFGYNEFEADPQKISSINKTLELNQKILRFLITTPPVGKPTVKRGERYEGERVERVAPQPKVLTNEALEEKLEEILK
ncbi:MAG: hypothetical protein A3H06_00450 [Candidatus Colwellbacteria bacterium RIFCSPLOWO2_12_FULL_44_13]|uniref:Small ribosomal subunit protein bS6 n=1 Tax=Candidatus Colwellbacteria bacterium RIFCSPLOWO2_12_FULL_44_13 TaxID=1797694 RepID=A0A1G1Z9P0_9BACT|nr:MAG: hypothetical protein A3H06_00450 [Candidatus Colwellbacteria bacterium RIFCSPLOWO2_12_FULL_44_13]